jgi:NADH pyrophosphatase NudC (nudix superfamily)
MEMNYCRRCGATLTAETNGPYTCKNSHVLYANPAPTVGLFLLDEQKNVLLTIRAQEPHKGMLDCIGGFVEEGETFEQALERETKEETGLSAQEYSELTYLTSAPSKYPFNSEYRSVLSNFYVATIKNDASPKANDDVAELIWKRPEDINIDDVGGADDVRAGLSKLLEVLT